MDIRRVISMAVAVFGAAFCASMLLSCASPNGADHQPANRFMGTWMIDSAFTRQYVNQVPVDSVTEKWTAQNPKFILVVDKDSSTMYSFSGSCWSIDTKMGYVFLDSMSIISSPAGSDTVRLRWDDKGFTAIIKHNSGDTIGLEYDHCIPYIGTVPPAFWGTIRCSNDNGGGPGGGNTGPGGSQGPDTGCQSVSNVSQYSWILDSVGISPGSCTDASLHVSPAIAETLQLVMTFDSMIVWTKRDTCYIMGRGRVDDTGGVILHYGDHDDSLKLCAKFNPTQVYDSSHQQTIYTMHPALFATGNELLKSGCRARVTRRYAPYSGPFPPLSWGSICGYKPPKEVVVKGRAIDDHGDPVIAGVQLRFSNSFMLTTMATTRAEGSFSCNLQGGTYGLGLLWTVPYLGSAPAQKEYLSKDTSIFIDTTVDTFTIDYLMLVADTVIRGRIVDTLSDSMIIGRMVLWASSADSAYKNRGGFYDSLANFWIPVSTKIPRYTIRLDAMRSLFPMGIFTTAPGEIPDIAPGDTGVIFNVVRFR
jgi:hypothetical protein